MNFKKGVIKMNKYLMGIIMFVFLLFLIQVVPIGCCNEIPEINQVRSNEDPMLDFYAHFDDDYQENIDNILNTLPGTDQKITLKDLAVNMDNTVRFILTPNLAGEIFIADSAPTGGETAKFFHTTIYMSASRFTERMVQTISIGTIIDPEYYGSYKFTGAVGINPSQNGAQIKTEHDSIKVENNIVVTIRTQYTGATPTSFHMHTGPSWSTGIGVRYTNQLNMDVSASVDKESKLVTVTANHNNPVGDDNMNHSATTIDWSGPSPPQTITHASNSFKWVWNYDSDDAKIGDYTVTITVTDLQEKTANNSTVFTIPSEKESEKDGDDDDSGIPGFEALFLVSGILVVIILFRKRKWI